MIHMSKPKKYRTIDFIWLSFKYAPLQTSFTILYTLTVALIPAYQTMATASFIDRAMEIFSGKREPTEIFLPVLLIMLAILFNNLIPAVADLISFSGANRVNIKLRELVLDKRAALEYRHIENGETQDMIARVCKEPTESFQRGFQNLLLAVKLVISSVSLLAIVMASSVISAIAILAVSVPLIFLSMKAGQKNYEMGKDAAKIQRKYRYLSEVLTNKEYVQERSLFHYSSYLQNEYSSLYDQSRKIEAKIEWKTYANMKAGSLITLVLVGIITALLIPEVAVGKMTVGIFIALVNGLFSLIQGMSWKLSGVMREYARLKEYLKDLNIFFALSEKRDAGAVPLPLEGFQFETLEFKNVTFRYPGTEREILKNCSFLLKKGKSYAIVGENGAGKSTITKLILGMYEDYQGEILLNGKDIRSYPFACLKALVSVVFQDFARYGITLRENILLGDLSRQNEKKLEKVLFLIGAEGLKQKLPQGLDTSLGKIRTGAVEVSGGEWQRIAIARLLYRASPINILDEPTAALDPIAESNLYQLFSQVNQGRFAIYITHRLGATKIMDQILVLNQGEIQEIGSHDQLMSLDNGIYKTMFESQKSWYLS